MKWSKLLNSIVIKYPDWSFYFINYKLLKKELKAANRMSDSISPTSELQIDLSDVKTLNDDSRSALAAVTPSSSVPFLNALTKEVAKAESFFLSVTKSARERFDKLEETRNASALLELQRNLVRLSEFAKVNYTSAAKILKKHDKVSNSNTAGVYFEHVLNVQGLHSQLGSVLRPLIDAVTSYLPITADSDVTSADEHERADQTRFVDRRSMSLLRQRDLNNDTSSGDTLQLTPLCVPLRRREGLLEVMVVVGGGHMPGLVKGDLDAGESTADAAARAMLEKAGAMVEVGTKIGEYLSTSKKQTMYVAYQMAVSAELDDWELGTVVSRHWLRLEDALSELDDNSAKRVLRTVKENCDYLKV